MLTGIVLCILHKHWYLPRTSISHTHSFCWLTSETHQPKFQNHTCITPATLLWHQLIPWLLGFPSGPSRRKITLQKRTSWVIYYSNHGTHTHTHTHTHTKTLKDKQGWPYTGYISPSFS
jgi:hypothetical protein